MTIAVCDRTEGLCSYVCDRTEGLCSYVQQNRKFESPSPLMAGEKDMASKSETVNLHVNSCVVNPVLFVKEYPQKKCVNPSYCYHFQRIKCVKDVSCVDHLCSVNLVTNVPTVAPDLPVEARLHKFWEKRPALGASPKVVTVFREGYTLPFRFQPDLTRSPTVISCYVNPPQEPLLAGGFSSAPDQKCSRTGSNSKISGFLQQVIFGTQTLQPVETYLGPQHLEQLFKHRVVQNGDTRDNKNLPTDRGLGHLHRFQRSRTLLRHLLSPAA